LLLFGKIPINWLEIFQCFSLARRRLRLFCVPVAGEEAPWDIVRVLSKFMNSSPLQTFYRKPVLLGLLLIGPALAELRARAAVIPVAITNQPQDQVAGELQPASFKVGASGSPLPLYQWYKNEVAIADATNKTYTIGAALLGDNGSVFKVVVYNVLTNTVVSSATSSNALLTVLPDTNAPVLVGANALFASWVQLTFSEPVRLDGATNVANYAIASANGNLVISNATLLASQAAVILKTSPQSAGVFYTVTVSGIADISTAANLIAPNTQATFVPMDYTSLDVGNPALAGAVTMVSNGFDIVAGGKDIGVNADQFQFNYQPWSGDFDVKVRVQGLSLSDSWAKAGLMARESLTNNGRFAGSFTTPNIGGSVFEYRASPSLSANILGSFPATYPSTWLRLQRANLTNFSGFASIDGNRWSLLGTANVTMSNSIYLGFAASGHSTNQTTTAQFRDFDNVRGGVVGSIVLANEPLGPSSRKTGLVISEIMYHPAAIAGVTNNLEFIELFNSQAIPEKIGGHQISGNIDYTFPADTVIPSGGFLVIAKDPAGIQSYYGISGVLGPYSNNLPGAAGTVRLLNRQSAILLEVNYQGKAPWPIAADGAGHSLVLARPSYGEGNVLAWAASANLGGSPGTMEPMVSEPLQSILINEFLAHTEDPGAEEFIELYNHSNQAVDLSGAYLSDRGDSNKFKIPDGTLIPAGGFVAYGQSALGFGLKAEGGRIYLVNASQTRVIDAVEYESQGNGISLGRFPDGATSFYPLKAATRGAANSGPLLGDIVINEIMYNPISGLSDDEYVELYNKGSNAVDVSGWKFTSGISITFPSSTLILPDGYLVVAKNKTNLFARYGNLNAANTIGDYAGTLANGGERLALAKPEPLVTTNGTGGFVTNTIYVVENEVTYGKGGRWGTWSSAGGSSLELIDSRSDNRLAANWGDSDETAKSAWTNFESTGTVDNFDASEGANDELHILALDAGEYLLDDIEVIGTGNTNVLKNGNFESGATNWTFQGAHDQSTIENVNYPGSAGTKCLHLRASTRGDTGGNRIRSNPSFTSPLGGGSTFPATLRAKARWLRGWPELLLRLHGNGLEAPGTLPIPPNLGTPGARNSRAATNGAPAIYSVAHSPISPAGKEAVVVTARVSDPDGISSLLLRYRNDGLANGPLTNLAMVDDGTGGDAIAGDGIYSATIPGQPDGSLIAFHIQAVDNLGATNLFPDRALTKVFPNDSPTRECLVRFGELQPPGSFGAYHMWITRDTAIRWGPINAATHTGRDQLSNAGLDGTFVYNNSRLIYNMSPHYKGSPWHVGQMQGPTNASRVDFFYDFPPDDPLLGTTSFALCTVGNPSGNSSSDDSGQIEQTSYLIFNEIGIHYNYRRYVHVFINGDRRSSSAGQLFIMEDGQFPDGDEIKEWYPDDPNGRLYKIEDWFEFADDGVGFHNNDATIQRFNTTYNGVTTKKQARYRHSWKPRALSQLQSANDYSNFLAIVEAASPASNPTSANIPDVAALDSVINIEQWMRIIAVQHTIGNWDSYGYRRGKNCYTYKGLNGRFELMTWDIDFTMGVGGDGSSQDLFDTVEPRMTAMWGTPAIARAYWRAFADIINGPLNNSFMNPILDAKAAAFTANGIPYNSATLSTIKGFTTARRSFIQSRLNTVTANFAVNAADGMNTGNNLLILTGAAPVNLKTLLVNGRPVTWTSVTTWSIRLVLTAGANPITVQGYDLANNPLTNAALTITVNYTGANPAPEDFIVINEIMYHPAAPDAAYIELYNTATNYSFDLSSWRLDGVGFAFPAGTILTNSQYLVVASSPSGFGAAFGGVPVAGYFAGQLGPKAQTIALVKPGLTRAQDVVVNQVRYENSRPWPPLADGFGPSLQLIDATQDNSRVSNWSDRSPGWRRLSVTAKAGSARLFIYLDTAGDVYIDDVSLVAGSVPESGSNLVQDGDFESALTGPWTVGTNYSNSTIDSTVSHSGGASLHLVGSAAGLPTIARAIWQDTLGLVTNNVYTLSLWYLPSTNASVLSLRTTPGTLVLTNSVRPILYTPGAANSDVASLPPYDPLWLNELQAENLSGPADSFGERDPWIELYNAGTSPLSLDGYYLSDDYSNLTGWAFPPGTTINGGQFEIIWADGQSGETSATELHTSFRLSAGSGSLALSRLVNGQPQIVDYLNYAGLAADQSYGDYPDGQPFERSIFRIVTPGAPNHAPSALVFINEWMASNTRTLANTDNGSKYDDWFELYNAGSLPADLSGFYLTDNLTDQLQFRVPSGYVVAPHGFLLVWADGNPNLNSPSRADLHVNFNLAKSGEAIGLFTPGGSLVDAVTFGSQISDISQGRYPDGGAAIYSLPVPTPRAPNNPPANHPPVMDPIADQMIYLGQTLAFTIFASDPDAPPEKLTFSLDNALPVGATIIPATGLFSWTPLAVPAPSTNLATVRVSDNGTPSLSATRSFNIIVWPAPRLTSVTRAPGGGISLSFQTIAGNSYRVEYKDRLSDQAWTRLGDDVVATSGSLSASDPAIQVRQRFYRIVGLD